MQPTANALPVSSRSETHKALPSVASDYVSILIASAAAVAADYASASAAASNLFSLYSTVISDPYYSGMGEGEK